MKEVLLQMLECATVAYRSGQLTIDEMYGIVEEVNELELAYDRAQAWYGK